MIHLEHAGITNRTMVGPRGFGTDALFANGGDLFEYHLFWGTSDGRQPLEEAPTVDWHVVTAAAVAILQATTVTDFGRGKVLQGNSAWVYRQCFPVMESNVDFDVLSKDNEGDGDPRPLVLPVIGQADLVDDGND